MRLILCLTLLTIMGLVLLSDRSAKGCTDWDEDGVCVPYDCNDYNTCGSIYQMYPVIYHRLTSLVDRGSRLLQNFCFQKAEDWCNSMSNFRWQQYLELLSPTHNQF